MACFRRGRADVITKEKTQPRQGTTTRTTLNPTLDEQERYGRQRRSNRERNPSSSH